MKILERIFDFSTKKEKVYKFSVKKPNWGLLLFFLILTIILYLFCLFGNFKISDMTMDIFKNILIIIISILGTSLLSIPLVEVRNDNSLFSEYLIKDIFSSDDFINSLKEENKKKLLQNLEKDMYFKGSKAKSNMYQSIRNKLSLVDDEGIYYEKCSYKIKCHVFDDRIEKNIIKIMKIRSFDKLVKLKNYQLGKSSFKSLDCYDHTKDISLKVDGKDYTKFVEIIPYTTKCSDDIKSGYNAGCDYVLNKPLEISVSQGIELVFSYKTYVNPKDLGYNCRLKSPCKKFSFAFSVESHTDDKYLLNASAFGFLDDAGKTPNHLDEEPEIVKEFDDWIFPLDGISVAMIKK